MWKCSLSVLLPLSVSFSASLSLCLSLSLSLPLSVCLSFSLRAYMDLSACLSGLCVSPCVPVCGINCHRRCQNLMPNLCGVNQKMLAEALQQVKLSSDRRRPTLNNTPIPEDKVSVKQVRAWDTGKREAGDMHKTQERVRKGCA